ncbi:hypothetical protein D3C75_833030 [compost metagenome]
MPAQVLATGYSGFYFRVLREGQIAAGDQIIKKESGKGSFPIKQVLYLMEHGRKDKTDLAELTVLETLSAVTRAKSQGWLDAEKS